MERGVRISRLCLQEEIIRRKRKQRIRKNFSLKHNKRKSWTADSTAGKKEGASSHISNKKNTDAIPVRKQKKIAAIAAEKIEKGSSHCGRKKDKGTRGGFPERGTLLFIYSSV